MHAATLQVRPLSAVSEMADIADPWNALARGVPMHGYDWLAGWLASYSGEASDPLVLSVWRDEQLIGLAPWRLERSARSGQVIRWLGDGEVCTDHPTILAAEEDRLEVGDQLADWLVDEQISWDLVDLDHADASDLAIEAFFEAMDARDCPVQSVQDDACWAIDLPCDWEDYLARQSKSHRKQLRRAERRVLDSDNCRWRPVRTAAELEEAWPILVDLHQRRRQSLGEPGCFASERFTEFHYTLARRLLEKDQLRISWIELRGKPAAIEYHFAGPDAVYAYQGGVEPELLDEEPGRLSIIATLKDAIAEGRKTFDFLRGDEPYKAHWRAVPRPTLRRRAVAPRGGARFRAQANRTAESVRGLLKSGLKSLGG